MLQHLFGETTGPYIIGHRGASGYAPENTMVSFERAIALHVDAIELDIHPSSDGELVVIHDPTLERTTDGSGLVSAHSLTQLRELDAGSWFAAAYKGERVPTLQEVLEWARGRIRLIIEVKQGPIFYQGIEERLIATLDRTAMRREVLVISFDHLCLRRLKELAPDIPTGLLYAGRLIDPVRLAREARSDALLPYWVMLTREEVETVHAAGLFVAPWGGPDQDYAALLALGVDALTSDFPDKPRLLLEAESSA